MFLFFWFVVSHSSHGQEKGLVLVLGQGDVGQLGLGEDVMERKKPALVTLPEGIVQAVAGGMHTVCLSDTGNVSSAQITLIITDFKWSCLLGFEVSTKVNLLFLMSSCRFIHLAVMTRVHWAGTHLRRVQRLCQQRWT